MKKGVISILALSLAIVSCNKDKSTSNEPSFGIVTSIEDLKVPSSFDWASSKAVMSDISVIGFEGKPKAKVRIDIYDMDPYDGGQIIHSGFTNQQGKLDVPVKVLTGMKEVVVVAKTMGIGGNRMTVPVTGKTLKAHFSGVPQARTWDKYSSAGAAPVKATNFAANPILGDIVYHLGSFNSDGVPAGMSSVPVSQAFLDNLDLVLPEDNHLPCDPVRQSFLAPLFCNQVTTAKDDAEVYVTFLAEGAGFDNALAYYYYPAGSPPANTGAIDSVFVIFPNASEGAGLMSPGDRVMIGKFPKNTTIEWVLLADMWNAAGPDVHYQYAGGNSHTKIFFGEDDFNVDSGIDSSGCADPAFNQHLISLTGNLNGEDIQLFSFEDLHYPFGDYDFNDCVFYATGDIYQSCAPPIVLPNGSVTDSDNDGIIDQFDDEPNNPNVACLNTWRGSLVFEDLWPSKGDYDFNDLVTGYVITHAIHAQGYVHEVRAGYKLNAAGAGYDNGFGTLLSDDLVKADIFSITGTSNTSGFVMDGDLVATPGSDLVTYAWSSAKDIIVKDISAGAFFNTVPGGGAGTPVDVNVNIEFVSGNVSPFMLGLPPYNAFLVSNQDQSREIHLADMRDSDLNADARFGTADDDSNPGGGRYYKTVAPSNLPWALDVPAGAFAWPKEKVEITTAYPQFAAWAMSGGMVNTTWYNFPAPGTTYP